VLTREQEKSVRAQSKEERNNRREEKKGSTCRQGEVSLSLTMQEIADSARMVLKGGRVQSISGVKNGRMQGEIEGRHYPLTERGCRNRRVRSEKRGVLKRGALKPLAGDGAESCAPRKGVKHMRKRN